MCICIIWAWPLLDAGQEVCNSGTFSRVSLPDSDDKARRWMLEPLATECSGMTEKVGITIWGRRVSPVFHAARILWLVEIADGRPVNHLQVQFTPGQTEEVIRLLEKYDTRVMICGAILDDCATRIEECGIHLVPFITGRAEHVVEWYAGDRPLTRYQMPGCHCQDRDWQCHRRRVMTPANGGGLYRKNNRWR